MTLGFDDIEMQIVLLISLYYFQDLLQIMIYSKQTSKQAFNNTNPDLNIFTTFVLDVP